MVRQGSPELVEGLTTNGINVVMNYVTLNNYWRNIRMRCATAGLCALPQQGGG